MFNYFFEEYKENYLRVNRARISNLKRLKPIEWFSVVLLVIGYLLFIIGTFLYNIKTILIGIVGMVISFILIAVYEQWLGKANRQLRLKTYQEEQIAPLRIQIIKNNLYSKTGINWLIDCCIEKKQRHSRRLLFLEKIISRFLKYIVPIITAIIGFYSRNITDFSDLSVTTVISLCGILVSFFFIWEGLRLILESLFSDLFPDKKIIDYLERDLRYIKTDFPDAD